MDHAATPGGVVFRADAPLGTGRQSAPPRYVQILWRYSPAVCLGCETEIITLTESKTHLHVLRGAVRTSQWDVHAPVHAPDKRFLQGGGEPRRSHCPMLQVIQLRASASDVSVTPAIEVGVASHVWSVAEIGGLV